MVTASAGDEHDPVDLHDRVINHIFGSGLALAGILSLQQVDTDTAEQLRSVIEQLDRAVHDLRGAAIARHVEGGQPTSVTEYGSVPPGWRRRLCRFSIDEVFAYAVAGHDFYRSGDHTLWAHESDGLLLSARSGRPLARREGRVFYDTETDVPLYYEDRRTEEPETDHS
jgi:hypothetical protein